MSEISQLFKSELTFESDTKTKEEVFKNIGNYLQEKGYVTEEFTQEIIKREDNYPTGLDLSLVSPDISNVAIPHTETQYCLTNNIVLVKLKNTLPFYNMIKPDQELDVKYLFIIINSNKTAQTDVLSGLMDYFTNEQNMKHIDKLNDVQEIYQYIKKNI